MCIDEVHKLAIALFHRRDECEQTHCLVSITRVATQLVGAQVHHRRARGIIDTRDSLVAIARWRTGRTIPGRFGIKRYHAYLAAVHRRIEPEMPKMV